MNKRSAAAKSETIRRRRVRWTKAETARFETPSLKRR